MLNGIIWKTLQTSYFYKVFNQVFNQDTQKHIRTTIENTEKKFIKCQLAILLHTFSSYNPLLCI